MKPQYWEVPALWPGETCVVIGAGPSLTQAQCDEVRGRARVIAVNNALALAPWADVHYFCDDKWWNDFGYRKQPWCRDFQGLRVTLENLHISREVPGMKSIWNAGKESGFCEDKRGVATGQNGGYQAINLAVHFGVKRILLLGFDMRAIFEQRRPKTHFFGDHPGGTSPSVYHDMLKNFPTLIEPLKRRGVEVINCTPGSMIGCFRRMDIAEAVGMECPPALTA